MRSAIITASIALLPAMVSVAPPGQARSTAGPGRVAYVSAQRVVAESAELKAAFARLPALQQERAIALRAKQQAIDETHQQLAEAADSASRVHLLQQEAQQREDLERATVLAQADVQKLQRDLDIELRNRVRAIVADLVKGQDVQLVVNDSIVLWAAPETDLSSAVIERLNATAKN